MTIQVTVAANGRMSLPADPRKRLGLSGAGPWSPMIGRPYGIAPLSGGRFVIADGGEHPDEGPDRSGAAIVDQHGRVLGQFGRFGVYDGQFWGAHAVATDRHDGIYIVDVDGLRVQKFIP